MNEELNTLLVALYVLINDHVALSRACRGRQLLLSATPVPCGISRETVNRSELAGLPGKAPTSCEPPNERENGRGLSLVAACTHSWGWSPVNGRHGRGKRVWFTCALATPRR